VHGDGFEKAFVVVETRVNAWWDSVAVVALVLLDLRINLQV